MLNFIRNVIMEVAKVKNFFTILNGITFWHLELALKPAIIFSIKMQHYPTKWKLLESFWTALKLLTGKLWLNSDL